MAKKPKKSKLQLAELAMDLLSRAADRLADDTAPDATWWRDLFQLTGQHMILTNEGWEPGELKQDYIDLLEGDETLDDIILDEVNAPKEK